MLTNAHAHTLPRTTRKPAHAANARITGAHDGRWISLPDAKNFLHHPLTGTVAERALLAGALRNGRVRLSPKAAKYVGRILLAREGERPCDLLATFLTRFCA